MLRLIRVLWTRGGGPLFLCAITLLALLAAACTDDDPEAVTEGTAAPESTVTPAGTPTATPAGTPAEAMAPRDGGEAPGYGAALALALEDEFGSEDVQELVAAWDIDVTPDGAGLPEGSGTAEQGSAIYAAQCATCHGANLEGGIGDRLVAEEPGTAWEPGDSTTVGNWWPYATIVWDYIHRAMPFFEPGTLTADEVYALTAFILAENEIIEPDQELNQDTLPQVEMPARDLFHACWPEVCYDEYGRQDGQ